METKGIKSRSPSPVDKKEAKPTKNSKVKWESLELAHDLKDRLSNSDNPAKNEGKNIRKFEFQRRFRGIINDVVKKIQKDINTEAKTFSKQSQIELADGNNFETGKTNKYTTELIRALKEGASFPIDAFSDKVPKFAFLEDKTKLKEDVESFIALTIELAQADTKLEKSFFGGGADKNIKLLTNHDEYLKQAKNEKVRISFFGLDPLPHKK